MVCSSITGKNPERAKQWVLPMLVPGSAEFLNMRVSQLG